MINNSGFVSIKFKGNAEFVQNTTFPLSEKMIALL